MEALVFFGVTFGFLALVDVIVGIPTYAKEHQRTNKMHNEFVEKFS